MIQVFDASAAVAFLLQDDVEGSWCEDRIVEADLVCPQLFHFETANIIRRLEAQGAIDRSEAADAFRDLLRLPVQPMAFDYIAHRVWELRSNLTVYDASYVATAERFDARLVTLDRKLAKAPGPRCLIEVVP